MRISSDLFNAFLKCSTKCWLRASGEPAAGGALRRVVEVKKPIVPRDRNREPALRTQKRSGGFAATGESEGGPNGIWLPTCLCAHK
jgi:hypothetical protein